MILQTGVYHDCPRNFSELLCILIQEERFNLTTYNENQRMIDNLDWFIYPVVNPDGFITYEQVKILNILK